MTESLLTAFTIFIYNLIDFDFSDLKKILRLSGIGKMPNNVEKKHRLSRRMSRSIKEKKKFTGFSFSHDQT
jgi:hypothetical protein